jgi:hypothetical protein
MPIEFAQLKLKECIEKIGGIAVGKNGWQIVVNDISGNEFKIHPEFVFVPKIHVGT